jgi:hypothetical protein
MDFFDLNKIFIVWVFIFSIFQSIMILRHRAAYKDTGWLIVNGAIITITGASLFWVPGRAGLIGLGLWVLLVLTPTLASRYIQRLFFQHHYREAYSVARTFRWLHPADGWLEFPLIIQTFLLAEAGQIERAAAIVEKHQDHNKALDRAAMANLLIASGKYREVGEWIDRWAWERPGS